MTLPPHRRPSEFLLPAVLLILCLLPRLAVLGRSWDDLSDDRDAYLGIAQGIAAGRGYCTPGTETPTAFRPPLYPLLLAPWAGDEDKLPRAFLHLLLAGGTAVLLWRTAGQLGLGRMSRAAATLFFAVDPLLVRYVALPMTETLCAFLSALLLFQLTRPRPATVRSSFLSGLTFGACVLARPTYWVFGLLYGTLCFVRGRFLNHDSSLRTDRSEMRSDESRRTAAVLAGLAIVIAPWVLRNWLVLGSPIVMTTHGGYTLLLGNNAAFYGEVIHQPWGTIWDGSRGPGQGAWVEDVNRQMDSLGLKTEIERNRWMGNLAKQTIREQPLTFLRACGWRLVRFWYLVPLGPEAERLPVWLLWGTGLYYSLLWLLMVIGSGRIAWGHFRGAAGGPDAGAGVFAWVPLLVLIVAFLLVHAVYWSDARMRAPVMPAVVLLAAAGLSDWRREQVALV